MADQHVSTRTGKPNVFCTVDTVDVEHLPPVAQKILAVIAQHPGWTVKAIAYQAGVSDHHMPEHTRPLEAAGLIVRQPGPKGRTKRHILWFARAPRTADELARQQKALAAERRAQERKLHRARVQTLKRHARREDEDDPHQERPRVKDASPALPTVAPSLPQPDPLLAAFFGRG